MADLSGHHMLCRRLASLDKPLPVWGPHVGFGRLAGGFTLCLALGQKLRQAQQALNVFGLPGNDIGQILDGAGQMGDAFFQCGEVHGPACACCGCPHPLHGAREKAKAVSYGN